MESSYLSPFATEANDSSSAISSDVSLTDKAPTFWLKFSILVVPGIGHTSFPWWWSQANASCEVVHPFLAAISFTRSNIFWLCSRFSAWNLGRWLYNYKNTNFRITNERMNNDTANKQRAFSMQCQILMLKHQIFMSMSNFKIWGKKPLSNVLLQHFFLAHCLICWPFDY